MSCNFLLLLLLLLLLLKDCRFLCVCVFIWVCVFGVELVEVKNLKQKKISLLKNVKNFNFKKTKNKNKKEKKVISIVCNSMYV